MKTTRKTARMFAAMMSLFALQACSTLGIGYDQACVAQFADQYPAQADARFVLPWQVGETYQMTQGNCTYESHNLPDNQHMSFDFRMPMGTPITAVDSGRVSAVIEQFRDGIDDDYEQANIIILEHEGGLLSYYAHLKFEGVLVEVDDVVTQGQIIGYSGDTGDSAYPHLHFFVQKLIEACVNMETHTVNPGQCPQIPVTFANINPAETILKDKRFYTAMPYNGSE